MMVQAPKEVSQDEPPTEEHIPTPSHDPLPSGEDRLQLNELMEICTKLSDEVLSLEQIKTNQAAKIEKFKKIVKNLKGMKKKRTHGLKRLYKRRIAEIDADEDLSLINEIAQDQRRMNDEDMFGVNDLDGDEVSIAADEVVTTAESVEGITAATTPQISKDDVTLAQTLIEIKAAKPMARGVIVQELSEFRTTSSSQPSQLPQAKDKGKGIMVEPEKLLKKKDQIALDEKVARKLEAYMKAETKEEKRIAREKDEANIVVIEE
uniref:Uncharacterized protein n=1 Tax=Tanacetum cinerariifolium TaxID=118510 RepID=A0A699GVG1_TANCI|nr:hypothetical protein [Tanacetum cinerariifolium]